MGDELKLIKNKKINVDENLLNELISLTKDQDKIIKRMMFSCIVSIACTLSLIVIYFLEK